MYGICVSSGAGACWRHPRRYPPPPPPTAPLCQPPLRAGRRARRGRGPAHPPPATSPVAWVRRFGQAAGGRRRAARRRRVSSIGGSRGGAAVWAQSRRALTHHSRLSSVGDEARSGLGNGTPPGGEPHSEVTSISLLKYLSNYTRIVNLLMSAIILGLIRVPLRGRSPTFLPHLRADAPPTPDNEQRSPQRPAW